MSEAAHRIQAMSPLLANQIAAGEVVERPASVLKELLENALDAGARRIEIEVEDGGTRLIRVRDDGVGIHPDDLGLALQRHASSKVREPADLARIDSLGFRGEALASIASVSQLRLASRSAEQPHAWQIEVSASRQSVAAEPTSHPFGSTVEVRELFFNTPARRKFLRSARTEFNHLLEVVRRIALSRFDIDLLLLHNQRQVLRLKGVEAPEHWPRRLAAIADQGFAAQALQFDFSAAGMRLWGWLGRPGYGRAQADLQYSFVNRRAVRDKLINHAIRQATEELLPPGRYAAYVLYLELDQAAVDVNVHPTKHELRFHEARLVHDFIGQSLGKALRLESGQPSAPELREAERSLPPVAGAQRTARPGPGPGRSRPWTALAETRASYAPGSAAEGVSAPQALRERRLLGQLGTYLLAQAGEELLLIERPRAQAALAQARLLQACADGEFCGQPLLLPLSCAADEDQLEALEAARPLLFRLGFELDRIGAEQLLLRQLPGCLQGAERQALLAHLLSRLPELARGTEALEAQLAALCTPQLWAGSRLSQGEAEVLLAALDSQGLLVEGESVRRLDEAAFAALFAAGPGRGA